MARRVRIHELGGPEVLRVENYDPGQPGAGDVLVRQTAIGVNFVDIYTRTGFYPAPGGLPATLGIEAAGIVEALGSGINGLRVGQRVAYAVSPGAYADLRTVSASALFALPDEISDETAAAMLNKGVTARYLLRQTYRVGPGDTILIHAAAGGVGSILSQWAKHLGAKVIGTVGSLEKVAIATANGCDQVILYKEEDFAARVRDITKGYGVDVVYDGVGKATFARSLDCLRPRGTMVSYGNASGAIEPFDVALLAKKGSLYLTRPTLATHIATREALAENVEDLMTVVGAGAVNVEIGARFALNEAAQAHHALESRATSGSIVLIP